MVRPCLKNKTKKNPYLKLPRGVSCAVLHSMYLLLKQRKKCGQKVLVLLGLFSRS
jgi:hypothetical protein